MHFCYIFGKKSLDLHYQHLNNSKKGKEAAYPLMRSVSVRLLAFVADEFQRFLSVLYDACVAAVDGSGPRCHRAFGADAAVLTQHLSRRGRGNYYTSLKATYTVPRNTL